ncbi:methyl-accepting chemotaxis protein [Rhizobium sp.]|jgi:methyl-accepting chemotaxis protein|uniref:methyl-accepting chemotaxis protein n=1 Tax=Rhizobium sp. TaxID=391 RepID=UPI000E86ACF5|nr:methyl-accepting chemotaxis protein [Rhizobium sp.]
MSFFRNLKILNKISIAFAILIFVSLITCFINLSGLKTQRETAALTDHTYRVIGQLDTIMASMVDQETGMRGYLVAGTENFLEPQKKGAMAFRMAVDAVRILTSDNPRQQERLTTVEALAKTWTEKVVEPEKAFMQNPQMREHARAIEASGAGKMSMDGIRGKIAEMKAEENSLLVTRNAEAQSAADTASYSNYLSGGLMVLVSLLSLLAIYIAVVKPVRTINDAMRNLAAGDHDSAIKNLDRKDEVGEMAVAVEVFRQAAITNLRLEEDAVATRLKSEAERADVTARAEEEARARMNEATSGLAAGLRRLAAGDLSFQLTAAFAPDFEGLRHDLNTAVEQLGRTLGAVAEATASIDSGSNEMRRSADDLSKRTEQQAASLEETAAALDQITANVSNSSRRVEEARRVAVEANGSASKSGGVVANAVTAMERIEDSATQIANIIGVIDEIAFQTNLLALNAGVEAARAGDAGKGFAVVAQEVRELAQRSANAAKEIKELIRKSTEEVGNGVHLVRDTGDALRTIEEFIVSMNQHMEAIATSSREQAIALAEVNTAVNQMDQVTQQNAAMVEETSASSGSLTSEASKLRQLVEQFTLPGQFGQSFQQSETASQMTHHPVPQIKVLRRA